MADALEAAAQEMGVEADRAATAYSQPVDRAGAMAPVSADWVDDSAPEMVCPAAWAVCLVALGACSAGWEVSMDSVAGLVFAQEDATVYLDPAKADQKAYWAAAVLVQFPFRRPASWPKETGRSFRVQSA